MTQDRRPNPYLSWAAGSLLILTGFWTLSAISQCEGTDEDGDGWSTTDGDCDDTDASIHPGAEEICNQVDDNCDRVIDENDVCSDEDLDGWTIGDGDCDDTDASIHPDATETCNEVDDNCDGTTDEGLICDGPWTIYGDYLIHTKEDGAVFTGYDCPENFFGEDVPTVNGVPFAVGPYLYADTYLAGIPQGGVNVDAPAGAYIVNNAYIIFPGGRCSSQTLQLGFNYSDGSSVTLDSVTIPHDCSASSTITATGVNIIHQGSYGGPCCDNWYWGQFTNPSPELEVDSIYIYYLDGCGGGYPGQIWGLSAD